MLDGAKKMNQKCFLCDNAGAKIIKRPNGYDGNHVDCPKCTHYKISRNAVNKLLRGYKAPASLSSTVRSYFEKTGNFYKVNTVTLNLN